MKTTVEIADSLFKEAKACAKARKIPLRELIEDGLRTAIQSQRSAKPFKLRDYSVGGRGMRKPYTWEEIRDIIYKGRGA